jgi:hypothetical protein
VTVTLLYVTVILRYSKSWTAIMQIMMFFSRFMCLRVKGLAQANALRRGALGVLGRIKPSLTHPPPCIQGIP